MTWVLSAITITIIWLAGNNSVWAWRISLVNQCLWLAWIVHSKNWGLLPMNVAMFVVAGRKLRARRRRNLRRWRAERQP